MKQFLVINVCLMMRLMMQKWPRPYARCQGGMQCWTEKCFSVTQKKESWQSADFNHPGSPLLAMRRIIAEPKRWTWEDKKAGRLPEVGAKCRQGHKDEIVVAVTEKFVVTECQDMSVCTTRKDVFMRSYNPIETPEEKAVRLCNEWCKTAADIFVRHPSSSATESMGGIYKAMLSGDLPAPGKE